MQRMLPSRFSRPCCCEDEEINVFTTAIESKKARVAELGFKIAHVRPPNGWL